MADKHTSSDLAQAFSTVEGLGAPVASFFTIRKNRWIGVVAAIVFFLISIVILCSGLFVAFQAYAQYGMAAVSNTLRVPLLVVLSAFILGVIIIVFSMIDRRGAIAVYEGGLAYLSDKQMQTRRWDEIGQFYVSIKKSLWGDTDYFYMIKNQDGSRFSFDNHFENVGELGRLVSENITPLQYQSAAASYNDGKDVFFGRVAFNQTTIKINNKSFAWGDVERITLQKGNLRVFKKDGNFLSHASISAASIPNLDTLLLMTEQIAGIEIGA
jgi:hypothetical protein